MFSEGRLKADNWNFEITINTSETDFLSSEIENEIHVLVSNGIYRSYYTDPFDVNGKSFIFKVYFENGDLTSLSLAPANKPISWDNIEEKELVQDKIENDKWLMSQYSIIAPAKYIWGTLESIMDKKTGSSDIVLQFNK